MALVCDKRRLQIGRLVGKRGKHCCEMIYMYQLDSLSLNFKSSKRLVLGIGNLLQYFTTMLTSFTCQSASLQSTFVAHHYGFNPQAYNIMIPLFCYLVGKSPNGWSATKNSSCPQGQCLEYICTQSNSTINIYFYFSMNSIHYLWQNINLAKIYC